MYAAGCDELGWGTKHRFGCMSELAKSFLVQFSSVDDGNWPATSGEYNSVGADDSNEPP